MSDYKEFIAEREKIDFLIEKRFCIKQMQDVLDGTSVVFEKNEEETILTISNANARKYVSYLFMKP
ncbi:hypothetical protein [Ectobacillus sp. sgz5001026]|uniref:hypothetical protein n=1 Tax=Ectobacillus sp. sgz5001026 TaxID=3242473 RepID=UPI0036D3E250